VTRIVRYAVVAALALVGASSGARAQVATPEAAHSEPTTYVATLVDTQNLLRFASTVPMKVRLERLTSDDEAAELSALGGHKRELELRQALYNQYVGRLEIDGRIGDPIVYARRYSDERGEHLVLIAERYIPIWEYFSHLRSVDYPFTVAQLDLAPDGRAGGTIYLAAKVFANDAGELQYQGFDFLPDRLLGVRRLGARI
jgi:hypothetical protein